MLPNCFGVVLSCMASIGYNAVVLGHKGKCTVEVECEFRKVHGGG
jgi:hypothetical protein